MAKTRFIFVTGGVYSSLGKGVTASSIGRMLKQLGYTVTMQKLDPYLNVDPTFISPLQHGELYITDDGAKADLDLGNYERFIDRNLNKYSTVTSGLIYQEVINNERQNKYDGKTVQVIPHITNQIINKIEMLQKTNQTDFGIIEIGGTIGDIESLPFIHAICDFTHKYGRENVLFAHCVPLISIASVVGELKTKPAQHSVKTLRSLGVSPDLLFLRSNTPIDDDTKHKLSWSCSINKSNIFECMDLKSTYFLPEELYKQKLHEVIFNHFKLNTIINNFDEWTNFTNKIKIEKSKTICVSIIGEFVDLHDAYFSAKASIDLISYYLGINIKIHWIKITDLNEKKFESQLNKSDAILLTPSESQLARNINVTLIKWLEKQNIPTLIYGNAFEDFIISQMNTLPKSLYGLNNSLFVKQCEFTSGSYETNITDSYLEKYINSNILKERHHHENEFNSTYLNELNSNVEKIGFRGNRLDLLKIKNHKFFYATYSNPEFTSKPMKPDPIYLAWLTESSKN